ncbi:CoA-binding protein [Tenacibaculum litoreum]|uniref:CoA-binding protein n=1 Tax=Tenacibaculum litoreum TaxID=321269 RepID=UPI003892FC6C
MKKRTLVLGASLKPSRYSNITIKRLRDSTIETVAIGLQKGIVADVVIETESIFFEDVDTVTLYLNPNRQKSYYQYIINLQPRRVIFNPGTENLELIELLKENGIKSEIACTLVLLSTKQY